MCGIHCVVTTIYMLALVLNQMNLNTYFKTSVDQVKYMSYAWWKRYDNNADVRYELKYYKGSPILQRQQLADMYMYMHIYSPKRQLGQTLGLNDYRYHYHVKPDMHWLSRNMNEIHWDDRLSLWNHTHHFPKLFTGMVDTFPVRVSQPEDSVLGKALYNPKYGSCVYKFQCAVDFLGRIILFSGPHLGTMYDGNIWNATEQWHILHCWELFIGDGAYVACKQMLCPHRAPRTRGVTQAALSANAVISHVRARVEHKNKLLERHNILGGRFRGGLELLEDAGTLLAHTENVSSKMRVRYAPIGPWPHYSGWAAKVVKITNIDPYPFQVIYSAEYIAARSSYKINIY